MGGGGWLGIAKIKSTQALLGLAGAWAELSNSPYVVHFKCRDSPYIVRFKCRDCPYVVHFKRRDCPYV